MWTPFAVTAYRLSPSGAFSVRPVYIRPIPPDVPVLGPERTLDTISVPLLEATYQDDTHRYHVARG